MKRYELKKYIMFNETESLLDYLREKKLINEYLKWRDENLLEQEQ